MIWKELQKTRAYKGLSIVESMRLSESLGLHMAGDLVDSEMIHYACFGYWLNDGLYPVHAFTNDPAYKIIDRIHAYKSLINFIKLAVTENNLSAEEKERYNAYPPLEGAVHILAKNGELLQTVEVAKVESR